MKPSKTQLNNQFEPRASFSGNKAKLKTIAFAVLATLGAHGWAADESLEVAEQTVLTHTTSNAVSVENTYQIHDAQMLLRIQQKIDADSREIDAMALRIKEMIRDRHNTDAINQQTSRQIEQLHAQLTDLMSDRKDAEKRWNVLLAEKQGLQAQVDALRDKNSDGRASLASLEGAARQREGAIRALGNDIDNARLQLQNKQTEIADLANKLGNVQGKYDNAKGHIADLNAELATAKGKAAELLAERSRLNGEIDSMQSQHGDSKVALSSERDAHENTLNELAAMQDNLANTKNNLADTKGDLANTKNNLADTKDDLAHTKDNLANTKNNLSDTKDDLANAKQEIAALQNARDALSQDKSLLQASASDLDSKLQFLQSELDNRIIEVQAASSGFVNLEDQLNKTNAELAQAKGRITDADGRMGKLKAELAKLNSDHTRALKDNQVLQSKIATYKSDIAEKRRNNDALASSHKVEQAKQAGVIASLQNKIDALTGQSQQAENKQLALQGEYQSRLNDIDDLNKQLAALGTDKDSVSKNHQLLIAGYQELNQKHSKLQSTLAALQQQNKKITAEHKALGSLRDELSIERDGIAKQRDAYLAQLNSLASVRDELAAERDGLAVERDTVEAALSALSTEQDAMGETLSSLRAERASLIDVVKSLKSEKQAIAAKRDQFSRQSKNLAVTGEEQSGVIKVLDARIAALEADAIAAQNTLASLTQQSGDETDKLRQQLNAAQRDLNISNDRLQALLQENQEIENERNQLITDAEALRQTLADELTAAELNFVTVQKAREDSSIPLRLGSADFFATGSAELTAEGQENLQKLADIISKFEDRRIVVAGHTDSKKIGHRLKSRYFSNWELSVARAASAVRFMQHQSKIDPINLSASGYSEYFPVADNASPEGRQMNRRVEVILYPRHSKEKHYSELEE